MLNRGGEQCGWDSDPQAETHLDSLTTILKCASLHGCGECVACSERALDLFLKVAHDIAHHDGRPSRG